MPDVSVKFYETRRKGIGIVECLILMIILGITFVAIFTTMEWAQRSYAFSRQDKESRELLFSWMQKFESVWDPKYDHKNPPTDADQSAEAMDAIDTVTEMFGGTVIGYAGLVRTAHIGGFTVRVENMGLDSEKLKLRLTIRSPEKVWVEIDRSYNRYSNETVSDDTVGG